MNKILNKIATPFKGTFYLINSHFWRTIYGPFLAFIFPSILLAVLGNIFRIQYVFPGIVSMMLLIVCLISLPLSITELRDSSLLKYIGSNGKKKWHFAIVTFNFYLLIALIALLILFSVLLIVFNSQVFPVGNPSNDYAVMSPEPESTLGYSAEQVKLDRSVLSSIKTTLGFFMFMISFNIAFAMSFVIGMLIGIYSKTTQVALAVGITIILPTIFLAGMVLSVDVISESKALQWISRFNPFRYTNGLMVVSMTPVEQSDIYIPMNVIRPTGYGWYEGKLSSLFPAPPLTKDQGMFDGTNGETMRRLILENQKPLILENTPNIFDFSGVFSVRKIPSTDAIELFMKQYLAGGDINNAKPSTDRFMKLWDWVQDNNYQWIDLFLYQNNELYTVADKVFNLLLPLAIIGSGGYVVSRKFRWNMK